MRNFILFLFLLCSLSAQPTTVGGGSGGGLPVANQAEAEAGVVNTKTMTPLRTSQAITALASSSGTLAGPLTLTSPNTITITDASPDTGAINVAKSLNIATVVAATTLTPSAAGSANAMIRLRLINAQASAIAVTVDTATDFVVTVPATSTVDVGMISDGSGWRLSSGPSSVLDLTADTTPASTKLVETVNATTGASGKSTLAQVLANYDSQTATLTNKRNVARVYSVASSATPTFSSDSYDCVNITALATAITSMSSGLTGTPNQFDQLQFRIKDDGTARAITWGASFANAGGTLPTTTTVGQATTVLTEWNSATSKWECVGSSTGGAAGDTVISPAQLTANADDWNPTGLSTATVIRVSGDSSLRQISSIVAPSGGAQRLRLENVGSNALILRDKLCGLGTAANRLALGGVDAPLFVGGGVDLIYDSTSSVWRAVDPKVVPTLRQGFYVNGHFLAQAGTTGPLNLVVTNSGTASGGGYLTPSTSLYEASYYGETGTTGSSVVYGGMQGNNGNSWMLANTAYWRISFRLQSATASDATNRFYIRAGFCDGATGKDDATDGVYLRYKDDVNSGNWVLVLRNNSSESTTNLSAGPTFSSSVVNDYSIIILPNRVEVWQNGVNIGSTTTLTNLPTARATDLMFSIAKDGVSAGTSTCQLNINGVEVVMYRATP